MFTAPEKLLPSSAAVPAYLANFSYVTPDKNTDKNPNLFKINSLDTSLKNIHEFADAVRKHWAIENKLHWCLDVIFREDAARARKDNSPLNMNVLRKNALALVNQAKYGRISKKKMMFKAALNPEVLLRILFGSEK